MSRDTDLSLHVSDPAIQIEHLTHRYGEHVALDDVSLSVRSREIFGLLGPNGSGKTTLFRIVSTLMPPSTGEVRVLNFDLRKQPNEIRTKIAVVFQSPSLDKQLTAFENLRHHGHLYGLRGGELKRRINESLAAFGVADRAGESVGRLSGGLRRRVELAKGMLTRPSLLLLDEPSTGLDPSARIELWRQLIRLRDQDNVTIMLTTHLMDEADRCDRLVILDRGKVLACEAPDAMKDRIGGDVITLVTEDPLAVQVALRQRLKLEASQLDGTLRLERRNAHQLVPQIIESAPGLIQSISVGRPTLEDVFVHLTGRKMPEAGVIEAGDAQHRLSRGDPIVPG